MINIMDLTVENLASEQLQYLKEHSIERLNKIIEYIQNDDFKSIEKMLVHSPAEDGFGEDNYYINFAYKDKMKMDINDLICTLKYLKEVLENDNN